MIKKVEQVFLKLRFQRIKVRIHQLFSFSVTCTKCLHLTGALSFSVFCSGNGKQHNQFFISNSLYFIRYSLTFHFLQLLQNYKSPRFDRYLEL